MKHLIIFVLTLQTHPSLWFVSKYALLLFFLCWSYLQSIRITNSALHFNFSRFYRDGFAFFSVVSIFWNKRVHMCTCEYTQLVWAREKTTVKLIELEHIKIEISAIDSRSDKKKSGKQTCERNNKTHRAPEWFETVWARC